jgi:hypothetical protein
MALGLSRSEVLQEWGTLIVGAARKQGLDFSSSSGSSTANALGLSRSEVLQE